MPSKKPKLLIIVEPEHRAWLEAEARRLHVSISSLIRMLIEAQHRGIATDAEAER
jgi:hypothetical protein